MQSFEQVVSEFLRLSGVEFGILGYIRPKLGINEGIQQDAISESTVLIMSLEAKMLLAELLATFACGVMLE